MGHSGGWNGRRAGTRATREPHDATDLSGRGRLRVWGSCDLALRDPPAGPSRCPSIASPVSGLPMPPMHREREQVSGNVAGMTATPLGPETLAGLPCPDKCVELGFPQAAIEQSDGGYHIGPLHLRTSPMEAAVLALTIEEAVGSAAMQEARRLRAHGHTMADTAIIRQVLSGLHRLGETDRHGGGFHQGRAEGARDVA